MAQTVSSQLDYETLPKTKYGHFSPDGYEYIIERPDTPRPWFNYLFNDLYHCLISQTGGGFSYFDDPKSNRILRWEHLSTDRPGRYLFLRDLDTGEDCRPDYLLREYGRPDGTVAGPSEKQPRPKGTAEGFSLCGVDRRRRGIGGQLPEYPLPLQPGLLR
jgi:hypothetical protein